MLLCGYPTGPFVLSFGVWSQVFQSAPSVLTERRILYVLPVEEITGKSPIHFWHVASPFTQSAIRIIQKGLSPSRDTVAGSVLQALQAHSSLCSQPECLGVPLIDSLELPSFFFEPGPYRKLCSVSASSSVPRQAWGEAAAAAGSPGP